MNIFNGFFRNERKEPLTLITGNAVICDSKEIQKEITNWIGVEKWSFIDFAAFIELIGIKTPVRISCESGNTTFKCITATNNKVLISLVSGDWIDSPSKIVVTEGQETRWYRINKNVKKGKTIPKVTLSCRIIEKGGKTLISDYSEFSCNRELKIDDNHTLKVEINEPYGGMFDKFDAAVLRNFKKVEDYLISLDNKVAILQVYEKIISLLNFSALELLNSNKILVSYIETNEDKEIIRSEILVKNDEVQEYAVSENGETFHRSKDGSWKYLFDKGGIEIIFLESKKKYFFSMEGSEASIKRLNMTKLLKRIKQKMCELNKFF